MHLRQDVRIALIYNGREKVCHTVHAFAKEDVDKAGASVGSVGNLYAGYWTIISGVRRNFLCDKWEEKRRDNKAVFFRGLRQHAKLGFVGREAPKLGLRHRISANYNLMAV